MQKIKASRSGTTRRETIAHARSLAAKRRFAAQKSSGDVLPSYKAPFDFTRPGASVGMPYESLLDAVKIVQAGLPVASVGRLQRTSGLTLERIKQAARISEGSFARRKESGRLSPEESERLLRIGRVFERAAALCDGDVDEAREWIETPIASLGNRRPLDLAQTEPGGREVEDLIGRIEYGIVS